tara:strand:+ start:542 stop:832 length:291 start_codon:yes stop_codon:yes gene_type:complete
MKPPSVVKLIPERTGENGHRIACRNGIGRETISALALGIFKESYAQITCRIKPMLALRDFSGRVSNGYVLVPKNGDPYGIRTRISAVKGLNYADMY